MLYTLLLKYQISYVVIFASQKNCFAFRGHYLQIHRLKICYGPSKTNNINCNWLRHIGKLTKFITATNFVTKFYKQGEMGNF